MKKKGKVIRYRYILLIIKKTTSSPFNAHLSSKSLGNGHIPSKSLGSNLRLGSNELSNHNKSLGAHWESLESSEKGDKLNGY